MELNKNLAPRILIAVDDPDLRRISVAGLRAGGFCVSAPTDGEAAMMLAESFSPDVLVVGARLLSPDGRPLYEALRESSEQYLLCITDEGATRARAAVLLSGADDAVSIPLSQDSDPVHVTGSGFVIGSRGVVLLKHKRLGFWLQPGGHIDPGETPWGAAQRECREETGLDVRFVGPFGESGIPELVHVDVHAGGRGHTHLDLRYLFDAGAALGGCAEPDPPAGESQEIGWFDWGAAIDLADPGLRGALESLRP